MVSRLFIVTGRVQGVGFRFFTLQEAGKIGVKGYVRNRSEGSVEVVAVGTQAQIDVLKTCLQKGPFYSSVQSVIEQVYQGDETFDNFSIRH